MILPRKKIINFILDEKFSDTVILTHDLFTDLEHEYVFVAPSTKYNLKHITQIDRVKLIVLREVKTLIARQDIGAIFLHSLYSLPLKSICQIPSAIKVFWFSWGYDIYERPIGSPLIELDLYRPKTKNELKRIKYLPLKAKGYVAKIIKRIFYNGLKEKSTYLRAIKRIDYFSGILPIEYDMVKTITNFQAIRVEYKYQYPKRRDLLEEVRYYGNNILIGNSANPTNNHLDILNKLCGMSLGQRKLISPLSYGGSTTYSQEIDKYGQEHFKDNWHPLTSFIEMTKYQEIINSCNVGIFLIERQQGMGNINMLLRRGCKVFLSESSVAYKYFKSVGIKIFSYESELTQNNIDLPLSEEDKRRNREIIMRTSTIKAAEKRFKDIYQYILYG